MTDNYIPYGPEWEKELMKTPKKFLIDMIRNIKSPDQPDQGEQEELWEEVIEEILNSTYGLEELVNRQSRTYHITRK